MRSARSHSRMLSASGCSLMLHSIAPCGDLRKISVQIYLPQTSIMWHGHIMQEQTINPMGAGEASEKLGVSRDALIRMSATGVIKKAIKMPGQSGAWLFDRDEIEQLANQRDLPKIAEA